MRALIDEGAGNVNEEQLRAQIEIDSVWHRLNDLNREMLRLPMDERRERWKEYYARLQALTKPAHNAQ